MSKIIVIGSSNTDMVIKTSRLPVPGETLLGGTVMMNPGGKGANQAVAAARLRGKVIFVAKTGNDIFGKQCVELLENEGINALYMFSDMNNPSGLALITVDAFGENCIVVASGANMSLSPEDVQQVEKEMQPGDIVLMQLEIPLATVEYVSRIAQEKGLRLILNPAPAQALPPSLMKRLYAITPNRIEAEIISGIKVVDWESAERAAKEINQKGVEIVIITLGAEGALIMEGGNYHRIPATKVETIDTTAAGDVFNGALCVAIIEGKTIVESVEFACKASALATTQMGAQSSIPYRNEVEKLEA